MELILASTSVYRRTLLERLNLPFRSVAPEIDEDVFKNSGLTPEVLAETLAVAKAKAVWSRFPKAVVIGSDQVATFEGRILGKPATAERAVDQLLGMAGRPHRLVTSVAIADANGIERFTDVATLHLRAIDREEAVRYVEADRPLDCAGSYKIEELGISLFDRIESGDHTAIVGLPLIELGKRLRARGFRIP